MMRNRWRILVMLLLLLVVGGLLASAGTDSGCAEERKTDEELLQIASHDLVHELREAAARALTDRLWARSANGEQIPLDYLEDLVRSSSPELRRWVSSLLLAAYMEALSRGGVSIDELFPGIYTGESYELRLARASVTMLALFITRAFGLPIALFRGLFESPEQLCSLEVKIHERLLEMERGLRLELLHELMNLMRGGEEELWGYRFDGSLEVIRVAASTIAILFFQVGSFPPLSESPSEELIQFCPCEEWRRLAGRGETPELRLFAAAVYVQHCASQDPDSMHELATEGESPELRSLAAINFIILADLSLEELMDLTIHGGSEELRDQASAFLSSELAFSCSHFILWSEIYGLQEGMITPEELYKLALEGETPQLRRAAGEALGICWERALEERRLTISDIPRRSKAEAHSLEQALIIFAAENTVVHPELAQAAIAPLEAIWGG